MAECIITLSGKQFCGKDTVAKLLLDILTDFSRIGLADAIKIKYSEQTGLSINEIETNKSRYRSDLIELGNKGRSINPDYWLNTVLSTNGNIIVPDVRMPHEIDVFKAHNAFCIRVEASAEARVKRGILTREADYTETALDSYQNWDYIISNGGDYEMLKSNTVVLSEAVKKHFCLKLTTNADMS